MIVWLGVLGLVVLGAVAQVHLRRTTDDVEYGLTPGQRRARSSPDGGHPGAQQIAGRGGIHRPDIQVKHRPAGWGRPTRRRAASRR